jgi:hypothetical protein
VPAAVQHSAAHLFSSLHVATRNECMERVHGLGADGVALKHPSSAMFAAPQIARSINRGICNSLNRLYMGGIVCEHCLTAPSISGLRVRPLNNLARLL